MRPRRCRACSAHPTRPCGNAEPGGLIHVQPDTPLLRLEAVSKRYGDRQVLRDVRLDVRRGEITSLIGASGSGKSTLISILAGLTLPHEGRVLFDGEDTTPSDDAARAALRGRRIGIVLQSGNLIPFLTAAENIELASRLSGTDGDED